MNKVLTLALLAGSLLLLNAPAAEAHKVVRSVHHAPAWHYVELRPKHMPRWLKRDRSFRHWYRHSPLQRDRRLAWYQLYEIYHWERRYGRTYHRSRNYWNDYYRDRSHRHHEADRRARRDRQRGH